MSYYARLDMYVRKLSNPIIGYAFSMSKSYRA